MEERIKDSEWEDIMELMKKKKKKSKKKKVAERTGKGKA